jgi:hypothetical protein
MPWPTFPDATLRSAALVPPTRTPLEASTRMPSPVLASAAVPLASSPTTFPVIVAGPALLT